jgi:hypothetical protein
MFYQAGCQYTTPSPRYLITHDNFTAHTKIIRQCSEQHSWMTHCFQYNKLTFNYTCDLHFVINYTYKVLILTVFCMKHFDLCNYTTVIDLTLSRP